MKISHDSETQRAAVDHQPIALVDTRIEVAGVMRCCLATVAAEYEGQDGAADQKVSIGMKSRCRYCKEPFTLVDAKPYPKWMPDWAIRKENANSAGTAAHEGKTI